MKPIAFTKKSNNQKLYFLAIGIILLLVSVIFSIYFKTQDSKIVEFTISNKIPPPSCSCNSGIYPPSTIINLSSKNLDSRIIYTVDGSIPNSKSLIADKVLILKSLVNLGEDISHIPTSPRWLMPLNEVDKAIVLRASVVDNYGNMSEPITRTFFISDNKKLKYSLPVISIVSDYKNLFDHKLGIFVMGKTYEDKDNYVRKNISLEQDWWRYPGNYSAKGKNALRSMNFEFFENNQLEFSFQGSIKVSGNATRAFSQKSFNVLVENANNSSHLEYQLFPDDSIKLYKDFVLRNAGNDWGKAMMRDAFVESLLRKANYYSPAYRSVILFINGAYWGIYQMCQRQNENYFAIKYNMQRDKIVFPKYIESTTNGNKYKDSNYMNLLSFIAKNDLKFAENYKYILTKIDVENFIDYIIAEIFFANTDWPTNNSIFWRYETSLDDSLSVKEKDGKYRWIMNDFDFGYGSTCGPDYNMFSKAQNDFLFKNLLRNSDFLKQFITRFKFHLASTFKSASALTLINSMEANLEKEMDNQISRWRTPASVSKWKEQIQIMRDFAVRRPVFVEKQLNDFARLMSNSQ